MCRRLAWMFAAAALISAARAQTSGPPPASAAPPTVLRSSTQLVQLDVVVHDQDGHPVRGLNARNFRLTENGVAQTIGHLEEHSSQTPPAAAPTMPAEPPGVFTDYTPVASDSTLNILLIDAINMPVKDSAFVRYELQQYVKHADPNLRIAVFGLANRPILLQGFTSDPAVLRGIVERKLIARSTSSLLPSSGETVADPSLSKPAPASNGSPSAIDLAANLREFQAELGEMETQLRVQYTLDAFNTLAHYLAGFPGRKNLLWFSGSFPLTLLPDPNSTRSPEVSNLDQAEFRETINLFSKAQVAVYPIDARSLIIQPALSASTPGAAIAANQARRFAADLSKFTQTEAAEHATMDDLATSTGGHAFYNTNDLAAAVRSAVSAGTDYYTLSYTPANTRQDGAYHPLRVEVVDPSQTLQLAYRRGYYTADAASPPKPAGNLDPTAPSPEEGRAAAYKQAAMSRGAPTPQDLLFKVRVLPASATTETVVAPDNQMSPSVPANGPFRRYALDYIALTGELTFTQQPDGRRTAKVEFLAYVYDTEGRRLNATGKGMSIEATTTNLAKLAHGVVRVHLELSAPDRAETFLRIGMRDATTNQFGVIEVPASSLSSLAPATVAPAQPAGRPTPPKD